MIIDPYMLIIDDNWHRTVRIMHTAPKINKIKQIQLFSRRRTPLKKEIKKNCFTDGTPSRRCSPPSGRKTALTQLRRLKVTKDLILGSKVFPKISFSARKIQIHQIQYFRELSSHSKYKYIKYNLSGRRLHPTAKAGRVRWAPNVSASSRPPR